MDFKDKIKINRENLGYTLEELAKLVGVSAPTIQRYESGKIKNVRRDKIANLAKALNVSPSYLMGWKDDLKLEVVGSAEISSSYPYIPFSVAAGKPITIDGITDLPKINIPNYFLGKYAGRKDVIIMKVNGESMNKVIPNDSLIGILTNYDYCNLKNGDLVVFENNYEYSVKKYYDAGDKLIFKPDSTDPSFTDIVLNKDENTRIVGKVILYSVIID